jgi:hypothetical protein
MPRERTLHMFSHAQDMFPMQNNMFFKLTLFQLDDDSYLAFHAVMSSGLMRSNACDDNSRSVLPTDCLT